jgi:hypothetical protein
MGQELKKNNAETGRQISQAESELSSLTKTKEWELARAAVDTAGIVDPTPASDAISMGMSLAEGDWVGAALSGISMIPYAGDAVGKTAKAAKLTKTLARIERQMAAATKRLEHLRSKAQVFANRRKAAAAERARRAKEASEKAAKDMKCKTCPKPKAYGTQLPTTGSWKGEKGNSRWTSDDGSVSLDYKEGYPDFSTSQPPSFYSKGGGTVEIEQMGKNSDFTAARNAMRKKLNDPTWPGNRKNAPEGYTWHHKEDGVTMELVHRDVHDKGRSGAAHSGGESIVSGKDNYKQDSQF